MHQNEKKLSAEIVAIPVTSATRRRAAEGKVWLVGAGPGDADLLTVKALRVVRRADIIFYDQLVSAEIRALFPQTANAIYVGKMKNHHAIAQQDLNSLLVRYAQKGLKVCRVKGGDPFVFGRGGEELLSLRQAGINAEVVPGITAASGCTSAADIPLTHRGVSQGCTLVTGHGESQLDINWQALASLNHTLVFYMGVTRAELISRELISAGQSGDTPAAFIENGCRHNQRVIITSVAMLADTVGKESIQSPALIVVGEVVNLAEQLQASCRQAIQACAMSAHSISA